VESQKKLQYFSYPFSFSGSQIIPEAVGNIELLKEKTLPE